MSSAPVTLSNVAEYVFYERATCAAPNDRLLVLYQRAVRAGIIWAGQSIKIRGDIDDVLNADDWQQYVVRRLNDEITEQAPQPAASPVLTRFQLLNDGEAYIRLDAVQCIRIYRDDASIMIGQYNTLYVPADEGRRCLAMINGVAAPHIAAPAAEPTTIRRVITSVERYISGSGNVTWKGRDADGNLYYLRQANRELFESAGIWGALNAMRNGDEAHARIVVNVLRDGDFWKIVSIESGAFVGALTEDSPPHDADYYDDDDANDGDLKRLIDVVRSGNYVILDTETTGLGSDAEICQIAIVDSSGNTLLDTLVKPTRGIPLAASRVHGLTDSDVCHAPNWLNVNERVWELVGGKNVITYNADYDFRLMQQSESACNPLAVSDWHAKSRVCAMLAYAEFSGDWNDYHGNYRWHKLTDAARNVGYTLPSNTHAHSALGDCLMTLAVCHALASK